MRAAAARNTLTGSRSEFIKCFVDTALEICWARDPKGLYRKARAGQLRKFTSVDSPYEPPLDAELLLDGSKHAPEELVDRLVSYLDGHGLL